MHPVHTIVQSACRKGYVVTDLLGTISPPVRVAFRLSILDRLHARSSWKLSKEGVGGTRSSATSDAAQPISRLQPKKKSLPPFRHSRAHDQNSMLLDGVVYRLFQASTNKCVCGCGVAILIGLLAPWLEHKPAAESPPIRVYFRRVLIKFFAFLLMESCGGGAPCIDILRFPCRHLLTLKCRHAKVRGCSPDLSLFLVISNRAITIYRQIHLHLPLQTRAYSREYARNRKLRTYA